MLKKIISIFAVFLIFSCSFLNEKTVMVPISSRPSGASVYIDGQYFGETPTKVKLEPSRDYKATIIKKGYGTSNLDLETWYSVRGGRGADTTRCILDAMGMMFVIPAAGFYSVHCRDFKQPEYIVDIGNNGMSPSDLNLEITNRAASDNRLYSRNYGQQSSGQNSDGNRQTYDVYNDIQYQKPDHAPSEHQYRGYNYRR